MLQKGVESPAAWVKGTSQGGIRLTQRGNGAEPEVGSVHWAGCAFWHVEWTVPTCMDHRVVSHPDWKAHSSGSGTQFGMRRSEQQEAWGWAGRIPEPMGQKQAPPWLARVSQLGRRGCSYQVPKAVLVNRPVTSKCISEMPGGSSSGLASAA